MADLAAEGPPGGQRDQPTGRGDTGEQGPQGVVGPQGDDLLSFDAEQRAAREIEAAELVDEFKAFIVNGFCNQEHQAGDVWHVVYYLVAYLSDDGDGRDLESSPLPNEQ